MAAVVSAFPAPIIDPSTILNMDEVCGNIVSCFLRSGINFLGVDFDMTLIDTHTTGRYKGVEENLFCRVRPLFRCLLPMCVENGIRVAIVTHSPQVPLIQSLMHHEFSTIAGGIPVVGNDNTWIYRGAGTVRDGRDTSKTGHLACAAERLFQSSGFEPSRCTTLLIDDDLVNIQHAIDNSIRAVAFFPEDIHRTIEDLLAL